MSNTKVQMSNQSRSSVMDVDQCHNPNIKIWHLGIRNSIVIWVFGICHYNFRYLGV